GGARGRSGGRRGFGAGHRGGLGRAGGPGGGFTVPPGRAVRRAPVRLGGALGGLGALADLTGDEVGVGTAGHGLQGRLLRPRRLGFGEETAAARGAGGPPRGLGPFPRRRLRGPAADRAVAVLDEDGVGDAHVVHGGPRDER